MADEVGGGLGSLFQNKLFLQYLSGVGNSIAAGKGLAAGADPITQQNIQSQNMMKLLKTLLGPDGTKATFSNTGMNLTVPKESAMFSGMLQGTEPGGIFEGMAPPLGAPSPSPTPAPVSTPSTGGGSSVANPFAGGQSIPDISASDLAGLTTQDISSALGMKMRQDEISAERPYKELLMKNIQSEIKARELKAINPEDMQFPIVVPSVGPVSLRQWNALPKDQQEYAAYVHSAQQIKGTKIKTKEEFDTLKPSERENFLRSAMKDPNLMAAAERLAKAGAMSISGTAEKERTVSQIKRESEILDPDFPQKVLTDLQKDQRVWRSTDEAEKRSKERGISFDQARNEVQIIKRRREMDKRIKQVFPKAKFIQDGWYVDDEKIVGDVL